MLLLPAALVAVPLRATLTFPATLPLLASLAARAAIPLRATLLPLSTTLFLLSPLRLPVSLRATLLLLPATLFLRLFPLLLPLLPLCR